MATRRRLLLTRRRASLVVSASLLATFGVAAFVFSRLDADEHVVQCTVLFGVVLLAVWAASLIRIWRT